MEGIDYGPRTLGQRRQEDIVTVQCKSSAQCTC